MLGHLRPNNQQDENTAYPTAGRLLKVFLSTQLPGKHNLCHGPTHQRDKIQLHPLEGRKQNVPLGSPHKPLRQLHPPGADSRSKNLNGKRTWIHVYFLGSKITADSDCSHQIKRCLLLGRKASTNLASILKSTAITLPTKVHIVKAMVFPVIMYGYENWTIKKVARQRTDAFELRCWRRLLRDPWMARRLNQSILKEINSEYSLEYSTNESEMQYLSAISKMTE